MTRKAYVNAPLGQLHHRYAGPNGRIPIIMLQQDTSVSIMFGPTMDLQSVGVAIADFLDGRGA